jgi:hypothetical protein
MILVCARFTITVVSHRNTMPSASSSPHRSQEGAHRRIGPYHSWRTPWKCSCGALDPGEGKKREPVTILHSPGRAPSRVLREEQSRHSAPAMPPVLRKLACPMVGFCVYRLALLPPQGNAEECPGDGEPCSRWGSGGASSRLSAWLRGVCMWLSMPRVGTIVMAGWRAPR